MHRTVSLISLLLFAASLAAHDAPARRVGVEEFDRIVSAVQGRSDGKAADELAGLELTERASSIRLARWQTQLPGKRCREALTMVADRSAFLDLPIADIPPDAPPDAETQKKILSKTIEYVGSTISRLPNFFATRKTLHFEDTPPRSTSGLYFANGNGRGRSGETVAESAYAPMHSTGKSSIGVSYRDGKEMRGSKATEAAPQTTSGSALTTHGEFGPILIVVLEDAATNKITWGHWEQGLTGLNAVFRYRVSAGQTDYMTALPHGNTTETFFPAYHGEIAVAPDTGAILRVTVIADYPPPNESAMSSILVEYGPIQIGGAAYICPIKSVALAKVPFGDFKGAATTMQMQLNDVAFVDYHLFHAEARILIDNLVGNGQTPAPPK